MCSELSDLPIVIGGRSAKKRRIQLTLPRRLSVGLIRKQK